MIERKFMLIQDVPDDERDYTDSDQWVYDTLEEAIEAAESRDESLPPVVILDTGGNLAWRSEDAA